MNPEITYHINGRIESETWRNDAGRDHRLDGPAYRCWYESGRLKREMWFINGKYHRLDGPAIRSWYKNGRLECKVWCIHDVTYKTEAEFQVAVDLYKADEIAGLF